MQITVTRVKESKIFRMIESQRISPSLREKLCLQQAPNVDQRGFTLLELMIVLAILGTLIAIAVPSFQAWREHSAVNNATNILFVRLKQARSLAVAESRSVIIAYDLANETFTFDDNNGGACTNCRHLVMDLKQFSQEIDLNANTTSITFQRNGVATPLNKTVKLKIGTYYKCVLTNVIGHTYFTNSNTCTGVL